MSAEIEKPTPYGVLVKFWRLYRVELVRSQVPQVRIVIAGYADAIAFETGADPLQFWECTLEGDAIPVDVNNIETSNILKPLYTLLYTAVMSDPFFSGAKPVL